jgi:predicted RNA binding protein YcfA (HicA-like mRNA interferase family)
MKARDITEMIDADERRMVAQRGSRRQFKHPVEHGRATIAGTLSDEHASGTLNSILTQAPLQRRGWSTLW